MQKIMTSFAASTIAVAGLLGVGSGAWAQITLPSQTTSTPIPFTTTEFPGTAGLTFTKFDSSLGQLLSVQINVSSSIKTTLTVQNNAATASAGTARTQVTVSIYDNGGYLTKPGVDVFGDPVLGAYNVGITSGPYAYSLAPGASSTSGQLLKSGSQSMTFTLAADGALVNQFAALGGGSITLGVGTDTRTLLSNTGGNSQSTQVTQASATGNIVYTYAPGPPPVPEPGMVTFALSGGLGLAGMVVRGRRRAKNNTAA